MALTTCNFPARVNPQVPKRQRELWFGESNDQVKGGVEDQRLLVGLPEFLLHWLYRRNSPHRPPASSPRQAVETIHEEFSLVTQDFQPFASVRLILVLQRFNLQTPQSR
ncbi:hypothetical protein NMY22_g15692 [Coprinellus aureogranulatus]|nr:hypothetical protein NMY22_g15692 [Coprinellus aureogranulatus]